MAKQQKTLKVATFNLFNLVLPNKTYYGNRSYTQEEYNKKKEWISGQLSKMNADIVGFQEVFHKAALEEIVREHPLYKNAEILSITGNGQSPNVALLSRFPIVDYELFEEFPEQLEVDGLTIPFQKFSRGVLKVIVQLNEEIRLTVFVAHLKSKRPMIPDGVDREDPIEVSKGEARSLLKRASEANALRTILMDSLEYRNNPVIALGDLNDNNTAVTTRIISGQVPPRYWPMKRKKRLWDILLYHAKDIQARQSSVDTYYTHIYNGHYESLDHILLSQELIRENPKRIGRVIFVRVFNDHLIDETLTEERVESWQSDHAQVVATIELY